jgi:hypothetical protein
VPSAIRTDFGGPNSPETSGGPPTPPEGLDAAASWAAAGIREAGLRHPDASDRAVRGIQEVVSRPLVSNRRGRRRADLRGVGGGPAAQSSGWALWTWSARAVPPSLSWGRPAGLRPAPVPARRRSLAGRQRPLPLWARQGVFAEVCTPEIGLTWPTRPAEEAAPIRPVQPLLGPGRQAWTRAPFGVG